VTEEKFQASCAALKKISLEKAAGVLNLLLQGLYG